MNGAVVNVRGKGDKLAVWVTDSANTEAVVRYIYYIYIIHVCVWSKWIFPQMKIGKMVKERLEIPENQTIVFNVHKVSLNCVIFFSSFFFFLKKVDFKLLCNKLCNWKWNTFNSQMAGGENKARGEWEETDGGVKSEKEGFHFFKDCC